MPVRIGTGTGAVDPSALRVAGVEPTRIMVGTGSAAVEVWSASIYPQSGTWGPVAMTGSATTYATHTINEPGTYTIAHDVTRTSGSGSVVAAIAGPWGTTSGSQVLGTSTASTVRTLSQGDVINFQASRSGSLSNNASGAWSITKN